MKLASDKEKRVRLSNYLARTNRAWRFANILSMSFETFETRVVMDNSPDRLSWKIQLSRDLSGWKMCYCLSSWLWISSSTVEMLSSVCNDFGRPLPAVRSIVKCYLRFFTNFC